MSRLPITDTMLNKLGFSEYWDEHGTWGGKTLTFNNGVRFRIIEQKEMDDDTEGYASFGRYIAHHYYFAGWFAIPEIEGDAELFFLHEMYECIEKYYPTCLEEFVEKCKALKMQVYIDEYLSERGVKQNGV